MIHFSVGAIRSTWCKKIPVLEGSNLFDAAVILQAAGEIRMFLLHGVGFPDVNCMAKQIGKVNCEKSGGLMCFRREILVPRKEQPTRLYAKQDWANVISK